MPAFIAAPVDATTRNWANWRRRSGFLDRKVQRRFRMYEFAAAMQNDATLA